MINFLLSFLPVIFGILLGKYIKTWAGMQVSNNLKPICDIRIGTLYYSDMVFSEKQ